MRRYPDGVPLEELAPEREEPADTDEEEDADDEPGPAVEATAPEEEVPGTEAEEPWAPEVATPDDAPAPEPGTLPDAALDVLDVEDTRDVALLLPTLTTPPDDDATAEEEGATPLADEEEGATPLDDALLTDETPSTHTPSSQR